MHRICKSGWNISGRAWDGQWSWRDRRSLPGKQKSVVWFLNWPKYRRRCITFRKMISGQFKHPTASALPKSWVGLLHPNRNIICWRYIEICVNILLWASYVRHIGLYAGPYVGLYTGIYEPYSHYLFNIWCCCWNSFLLYGPYMRTLKAWHLFKLATVVKNLTR